MSQSLVRRWFQLALCETLHVKGKTIFWDINYFIDSSTLLYVDPYVSVSLWTQLYAYTIVEIAALDLLQNVFNEGGVLF